MPPKIVFLTLLAFSFAEGSRLQDRPPGTNRLIHESSPYLLLHARNPVDWYPWGEEAIELARKLDRPIFLSIGYSTCYWCHRMEEDVFEDESIAALMNASFVSIKVDREERPDLDDIYMTATQLMTRRGGWPNSVFLTPDLKPFFAGTYFPPEDRANQIGFPTVLRRIAELWKNDRAKIVESSESIASGLAEVITAHSEPASDVPGPGVSAASVETLSRAFDETWGGFSPAPKFPSPGNLYLLEAEAARGDERALRMLVETLHKMGEGAIYDQLGGGFHRYATDREWRVPHFEKMLYDNAALAELLVDTVRLSKEAELERLARGTLDFVVERMTSEEGGFFSAIDAQTDGREGAYYVWTRDEIERVLTAAELSLLAPVFGFDGAPNFEGHEYTIYLTASLSEHARKLGLSREALRQEMEPALEKLRSARAKRSFPLVDDKILTDWNGMMLSAMAKAGSYFEEPRYRAAAEKAGSFLLASLRAPDGSLRHVFRNGNARVEAFLDDYAFLTRGLVDLYRETGERKWLEAAEALVEEMESRLRDPRGGYYQSAPRPYLLFASKTVHDGALPSGNAVATTVLLDLSELTGRPIYRERAAAALRAFAPDLKRYPEGANTLALAVERFHQGQGATKAASRPAAPELPLDELAASVVEASLETRDGATDPEWVPFAVTLRIERSWHVNANPASSPYLIPTEIRGDVRAVAYPPGRETTLAFSDDPLSVYEGSVTIRGERRRETGHLELVYQACDETRCLSPVTKALLVSARREPNEATAPQPQLLALLDTGPWRARRSGALGQSLRKPGSLWPL